MPPKIEISTPFFKSDLSNALKICINFSSKFAISRSIDFLNLLFVFFGSSKVFGSKYCDNKKYFKVFALLKFAPYFVVI